jgi:hypothetical protein
MVRRRRLKFPPEGSEVDYSSGMPCARRRSSERVTGKAQPSACALGANPIPLSPVYDLYGDVVRSPARTIFAVLAVACMTVGLAQGRNSRALPDNCAISAYPQNASYIGSDTCQGCHEETYERMASTSHWQKMMAPPAARAGGQLANQPGCESCHGPGSAHVEGGGDRTKIFTFTMGSAAFCNPCRSCHADLSLTAAGSFARQR